MADADALRRILDPRKYEYLSTLGAGAFGIVIKARHIPLGIPVAVKILHGELVRERQTVERMRIEAQAMARLSTHPHIVEVLDYGKTEYDRPYMSMRFLEGRSLQEELRDRKTLPPHEAVQIALQVLSGLEAAHGIGIVHRDIKPGNVFLARQPDGTKTVKLLDFGIAKVVQSGLTSGQIRQLSKPTADGSLMGTPQYFAPEQARGRVEEIDARSDLYAVGTMLFKMLVGISPFEKVDDKNSVRSLLQGHVQEPPPSASGRSGLPLPRELDEAILKAMAKDKMERHQTAGAFAAALRAIEGARLISSTPPELPASSPFGTEQIGHQAMLQEISRRQRAKEEEERAKRRTFRIDDQASAQELDRLRQEGRAWRDRRQTPARHEATEPMPTLNQPPPRSSALTAGSPAQLAKQGFSRREAIIIAVACGLVIALSVIVVLLKRG